MFGSNGIETGVAPTPAGPSGKRASMYNGLADSIWVGSENKAAAASGSSSSARRTARTSSVRSRRLPGDTGGHRQGEAALKAKGVDVSAFTVKVNDKTTFLFPITDHASQIEGIMQPAMDAVMAGKADRHR